MINNTSFICMKYHYVDNIDKKKFYPITLKILISYIIILMYIPNFATFNIST